MRSNHQERIEILRQMLATYGQEASTDRLKGYLTVTAKIPIGSLAEAVRSAMGNSQGFPPGPGEILSAWRWKAGHSPTPAPRDTGPRIGPGEVAPQIAAQVGAVRMSNQTEWVWARAKEIRAEGKLVPKTFRGGNLLAHIYASLELGANWSLSQEARDRLCRDMRQHEAEGGDVAWWEAECKNPTVTR